MYSAIVKNDDQTWDIFFDFNYSSSKRLSILQDAWDSKLPIIGMELTAHKNKAKIGAVWDGNSFSGGFDSDSVNFIDLPNSEEFWELNKTYGFLCNNELIAIIKPNPSDPISDICSAAFAGEVTLIKHQGYPLGTTLSYNSKTGLISLV
jgi:hypothetical protein